ncbi:hypothetical protein K432DRAFT_378265 [Lepidopterella palustris CBS 459.81]|uniref:Uncharacterized protein n=1 Tax=Lepidopterella palustris CBS 459.81 TaxID=1314670 RepID=A0A8E2EJA7_9PEZI|nr:hypothetical protein K432DRAFT_378265 [Lepidopterella palustris CBS 459.81]
MALRRKFLLGVCWTLVLAVCLALIAFAPHSLQARNHRPANALPPRQVATGWGKVACAQVCCIVADICPSLSSPLLYSLCCPAKACKISSRVKPSFALQQAHA